jgi:hypothetical protein
MRWVEEWTKAQAWGCSCITPRIIQEVQASKLGDAPDAPLLHRQKLGHLSRYYIFIASCTMRFSWSVSCFCFQFSFVSFAAINGLITSCFFWRRWTHFSFAKNTLVFTLIVQRVFSFSATAFSLHFFTLIFVQILLYLFIKVYFCPWSLLVFIKRVGLKKFKWCWKRQKALCKKVVQEGACVDCGLGFCMSCLMYFW